MSTANDEIKVVLGNYRGIKIPKVKVEISDAELEEEIETALKRAAKKIDKEGPADTGDETLIDFVGYTDGVAFDGGSGEHFPLVLGSGQFVPGFEEQLLGAKKGDHVSVNIKFPDQYHAELSGKDAVFEVDVREVRSFEVPELCDDVVKDISPCDTVDEFRQYVRAQIESVKKQENTQDREAAIVGKILETSMVLIPKEMIEESANNFRESFIKRIQSQGLEIDDYLSCNNMTMADLEEASKAQAEHTLKGSSVLAEVAKAENITVSDRELEAELEGMARSYGMEIENIKEMIGEAGLELVRGDIAAGKALDLLLEITEEV